MPIFFGQCDTVPSFSNENENQAKWFLYAFLKDKNPDYKEAQIGVIRHKHGFYRDMADEILAKYPQFVIEYANNIILHQQNFLKNKDEQKNKKFCNGYFEPWYFIKSQKPKENNSFKTKIYLDDKVKFFVGYFACKEYAGLNANLIKSMVSDRFFHTDPLNISGDIQYEPGVLNDFLEKYCVNPLHTEINEQDFFNFCIGIDREYIKDELWIRSLCEQRNNAKCEKEKNEIETKLSQHNASNRRLRDKFVIHKVLFLEQNILAAKKAGIPFDTIFDYINKNAPEIVNEYKLSKMILASGETSRSLLKVDNIKMFLYSFLNDKEVLKMRTLSKLLHIPFDLYVINRLSFTKKCELYPRIDNLHLFNKIISSIELQNIFEDIKNISKEKLILRFNNKFLKGNDSKSVTGIPSNFYKHCDSFCLEGEYVCFKNESYKIKKFCLRYVNNVKTQGPNNIEFTNIKIIGEGTLNLLSEFKNLVIMKLSSLDLQSIPLDVFLNIFKVHSKSLSQLTLNEGNLTDKMIFALFSELSFPELEGLDLSTNMMKSPEIFLSDKVYPNLRKLKYLDLSYNDFKLSNSQKEDYDSQIKILKQKNLSELTEVYFKSNR